MNISEKISIAMGLPTRTMQLSNGVEFVKGVEVHPDFENNDANFVKLLTHMTMNSKYSWLRNILDELELAPVKTVQEKVDRIKEEVEFEYETVGSLYDYLERN